MTRQRQVTENVKNRILIVSSKDISLLRFRGKLIELLIENNYEVLVAAPSYESDVREKLSNIGAQTHEVSMSRVGLSLFEDWQTYKELKQLMSSENVDLVFPYTIKPVMYSSLAARKMSVKTVGLVNGLGYVFSGSTLKQRLLQKVIVPAYRYCVAMNHAMVFQNSDDQDYFRSSSILSKSCSTHLVAGSGVNLKEFKWREPRGSDQLRFAFVGRLLVEKGIYMFLEAAQELKKKWPEAEFHVFGEPQNDSPNSIKLPEIELLAEQGVVTYHGRCSDIAKKLGEMDVIVCPSWYREGVPRALLEALSVGLALIVADTPGCRDTVRDGENGFLVPPKNLKMLTRMMECMLDNPQRVHDMSFRSRGIAEDKYDVKKVNAQLLSVIEKVCSID